MRRKWRVLACLLLLAIASSMAFAEESFVTAIHGAGANSTYALYTRWSQSYRTLFNTHVVYQPLEMEASLDKLKKNKVDFISCDQALSKQTLAANYWVQFPSIIQGVVPVINLPDVDADELTLNGKVLADIYLGKIKNWNDRAIVVLNPHLRLPDLPILVLYRSDASGATFFFTDYLSKVSSAWKRSIGSGLNVAWRFGLAMKDDHSMVDAVKNYKGSIGYLEYSYVEKNHLTSIRLINRAGKAISPTINSFQAAADKIQWKEFTDFSYEITNQSGEDSWPIIGASFIVMPQFSSNPAKTKAILNYFNWAYDNGRMAAILLSYVPLPDDTTAKIIAAWHGTFKDKTGREIW